MGNDVVALTTCLKNRTYKAEKSEPTRIVSVDTIFCSVARWQYTSGSLHRTYFVRYIISNLLRNNGTYAGGRGSILSHRIIVRTIKTWTPALCFYGIFCGVISGTPVQRSRRSSDGLIFNEASTWWSILHAPNTPQNSTKVETMIIKRTSHDVTPVWRRGKPSQRSCSTVSLAALSVSPFH